MTGAKGVVAALAVIAAALPAFAASSVTRREAEAVATEAAEVAAGAMGEAVRAWAGESFVSRTNEWKLAERRHALLVIDLNAENGGRWRSFELKASTNNFALGWRGGPTNMCYWCCSDEADGYADGGARTQDRMRLYWLTTRGAVDRDGRAWTRIGTTLDLEGAYPEKLAVLLSPELCREGGWLGEENEEVVWSYTRADATGAEKDTNGAVLWHPVQPVRWFRDLPEWAK